MAFGKKELFKKIYDIFIQSEDYKSILEKFSKEKIEKNVLNLRAEAENNFFSHTCLGGAVGAIPIVDLLVQKFYIKKKVLKQVGEIFGIDVKFIDEESAKKEKKKEKDDYLINIKKIDGEKELEESTKTKVGNGAKCLGQIAAVGLGVFLCSQVYLWEKMQPNLLNLQIH